MEIAFVSSNRIYLEIEKSQEGLTSKVLKTITQNPSQFIATMLLGNNVALVLYGIFMGDRILQLFFTENAFNWRGKFDYYILSNPYFNWNYIAHG